MSDTVSGTLGIALKQLIKPLPSRNIQPSWSEERNSSWGKIKRSKGIGSSGVWFGFDPKSLVFIC